MATLLKGYWYNATMPGTYRKLSVKTHLRCDHAESESSQTTSRQRITHNKKDRHAR